jgi:hypothetical protein
LPWGSIGCPCLHTTAPHPAAGTTRSASKRANRLTNGIAAQHRYAHWVAKHTGIDTRNAALSAIRRMQPLRTSEGGCPARSRFRRPIDHQQAECGQRLHTRVNREPHLERAVAVENPGGERHDDDEEQPEQVPWHDRAGVVDVAEEAVMPRQCPAMTTKLMTKATYWSTKPLADWSISAFVAPTGTGRSSAGSVMAMATTASEKKMSRSAESSSTSALTSGASSCPVDSGC